MTWDYVLCGVIKWTYSCVETKAHRRFCTFLSTQLRCVSKKGNNGSYLSIVFICAAWSVFPVFGKHFYFSLSFYCYGVKNIDTLLTNLEICLWLLLWCVTWYPILIVLTIFFFYNCAYLQSFGCAMFITVKVLQVLRVFNPRVFCLGWVGGICCLCQVCSDNFHRKHQPL